MLAERWRHAVATNCNGRFADVTIDLEPRAPGGGIRLVDHRPDPPAGIDRQDWAAFATAFFGGVRRALRTAAADGTAVTDVTVTLRAMVAHPVDSSAHGFALAGDAVTRQALAKAGVPVTPRDAGSEAGGA